MFNAVTTETAGATSQTTLCLKKTRHVQFIWQNFTSSQLLFLVTETLFNSQLLAHRVCDVELSNKIQQCNESDQPSKW